MSVRASEIPSLKCLYRELGYETEFRARQGTLYYSTRRWSESYMDPDGTPGQAMIHWSTAKGKSDLEKLSQKYLDNGYGIKLWPQNSDGGLQYPRDQKRLVDLLAQLFWNQNTNIDKADRKRACKQQKQYQTRESIPFSHADTHTTGPSTAEGQSCDEGSLVYENIFRDHPLQQVDFPYQNTYASPQLNLGNDHIYATQLYANGRAKFFQDVQKTLPLNDQHDSPVDPQDNTIMSALAPTPIHGARRGEDVSDFVGSDDETEVHEHRQGLVITLRFTLNILQFQSCMASYAGGPAPTANMISLPTPTVAAWNEMPKRQAICPDPSRARNELPEIIGKQACDNPETPRHILKGAVHVSGLSGARLGTKEVEGTEQRLLGVTEASIIPSNENEIEVHTPRRTPSRQSAASEELSDISVDNDDEDDENYTPGKVNKAKRNVPKRPKIFTDRSKAAKKRRLGAKRQDYNGQSLPLGRLRNSELYLDGETSLIARNMQSGLDNLDQSLARGSGERGDQEHSLPSPAHTHLEALKWDIRRSTADLEVNGQEFTRDLGTAPPTQTREGEGMGGDDRVHMGFTCDAEKLNHCYEDDSYGKPILVHEESPPAVENRPLYPPPTSWQSDLAAAIKAIGGMAGVPQPLAPLNRSDSAKIKDEQNGLPYHSDKDMLGGESGSVARSIALPRGTPETGRVPQFPPLPYWHAMGQSGRGANAPYSPSQRVVSPGRLQDLDWMPDAVARSVPTAMVPQDTERATNICRNFHSKPTTDTLAFSNQRSCMQNEEERTRSPHTLIIHGGEQSGWLSRSSIRQPNPPLMSPTQTTTSSAPRAVPPRKLSFDEAWFVLFNRPSGGQHPYRLKNLKLDDMNLASTFEHAATKVPTGTEIRNLSLTIRSFQYDKEFPELTEMVERDDEDGFERVKLEFIDSIREYMEEGVTRYKFLLEVNPKGKGERQLVSSEGGGLLS